MADTTTIKDTLIRALKKKDKGIKCITAPDDTQKYCFICSRGHYFLLGVSHATKSQIGCPVCFVEYHARKQGNDITVKKCGVYANKCSTMYICCNDCKLSFYASTAQLLGVKYLLECSCGHMSLKNPIIKARRIFEIFFEKPFVDSIVRPEDIIMSNNDICQVTGYDAELKIAFIHLTDSGISSTEKCHRICEGRGIYLVVIQKLDIGGGQIAWSVFAQLNSINAITDERLNSLFHRANEILLPDIDSVKRAVTATRKIMREQDVHLTTSSHG